MKKIVFLILVFASLISCDKNNDFEPNSANSAAVDVYVTGKYNDKPCYWKNTQLVLLDDGGISNSITEKIMVSGLMFMF